ncbi:MAG TPA: VOC family protein [Xanthobacteraceae bacterium]|nr:VOC family protein [Xanthobacteraceae bacterium]
MAQIRHIAFASDHPGKAADFYKAAFGFRELGRFGLDPANPDVAPRPSGVMLTDGHLNIAILKFGNDQTGVGIDHVGFHHFGVVVDDWESWTQRLEALGAPNITTLAELPKTAHPEIKFRGPDGVVFDISTATWPGAGAVDEADTKLPAAAQAAE